MAMGGRDPDMSLPDEEMGSDLDSRSNHSDENEQSEALHAIEPEGKTAEEAMVVSTKRQKKNSSRPGQGSAHVANRKNKRPPGGKRPPHQRKGRHDDIAVGPRRQRLSMGWMAGGDPDEDIDLHSNEDSISDNYHGSDDSGENGQVPLAIEQEGDTSEEDRKKAKKKRKKMKKERRDSNREMNSYPNEDTVSDEERKKAKKERKKRKKEKKRKENIKEISPYLEDSEHSGGDGNRAKRGDTAEEEGRKARNKRKKKKKKVRERESKPLPQSTASREDWDGNQKGAFEFHMSWEAESDEDRGVYI